MPFATDAPQRLSIAAVSGRVRPSAFGSGQVEDGVEFGWLFDWEIGRPLPTFSMAGAWHIHNAVHRTEPSGVNSVGLLGSS